MIRNYTEQNIKVLEGLEPVRKRPGMYIGSTDTYGLHHLVWEIFDNSVDEVLGGGADLITITLKKDGSISIQDNGRGIPTGKNETTGLSTVDTVFTTLHAGGKFDDSAYHSAGGLHGVGSSVVNALSRWCNVTVWRGRKIWEAKYINGGKIDQPLKEVGPTNQTGTRVHFKPDDTIFKSVDFNPSMIKERVREATYLFKGLKVIFKDEINKTEDEFVANNGIVEYVDYINETKTPIHKTASFKGENSKISVEIALQYVNDSSETIISFANSVKTKEGGSHETAFKTALTETINVYARKNGLLKEKDKNFEGADVREGLTALVTVLVPEALVAYEGQTKNKLFTQEAYAAVKQVFSEQFGFWLEENKAFATKIVNKALVARDARVAARKAREDVKKLKNKENKATFLSGKLVPAQSKEAKLNEIFLVEGDSAGGSAKLARDKKHQAILPLRGKILNVEKAKLSDLLNNEEISTIILALGAGINEDYDEESLRYHKVVIMTDADVDGSHIRILLLTFFYRFMRKLIENGHVYIALAPLYKVTKKSTKEFAYAWNEQELEELKEKFKTCEIQRYKGLGEMNADQLKETTMAKENRKMIKVTIEDAALAERRISTLMGDNASLRKTWIDENISFDLEE
ncbi:MAG: DNA topoisomerase IV subunit B [Mycoplasma sp.]|nr:DNA topoisomerase IV subunit B [Candidatus Hennigella equi]